MWRTYVDARVDLAFLLAELEEELERIMPNLEIVGVPAFLALPQRPASPRVLCVFVTHTQMPEL